MRWPKGIDALCFGGDYNPEQWPEEVWQDDVSLMRRAGVNLVSLGVFSWSALEPREGVYTFDWLDRVLDLLDAGGIKAALATPTASPPPWFTRAYPDALPVWADGTRLVHGSRDTYCASAPGYRVAASRITRALGERYAGHPALAMWHVHNEYGTWCHCDHVAAAFRGWLRQRYTTLDALNLAWTTAFWSQRYGVWEEILPPRATQYHGNPAHLLDFRRFLSSELFACFAQQRAILRELTPDVPVTTNFVFGDWVPVDHTRWAGDGDLDLVAIDNYPSAPGIDAAWQTAFHADLARSWAGGKPWLLMEQAGSTVNAGGTVLAKSPGEMARHSIAHIARGSRGAMFFQWRASQGGAEQYHAALVPHAGEESRVFREAVALGGLVSRLREVDGADLPTDVAILWDAEAWWGLLAPGKPSRGLSYIDALYQAHRCLWNAGIAADFAAPDADLSAYRLVVVPMLYLVSDEGAASVTRYVQSGGHVLVSYFSGIVDVDTRVRLGGYPGAFREVLGVRVEEFHPLLPETSVPVTSVTSVSPRWPDAPMTGRCWSEHVHLAGATAVASYGSGDLDGKPAITRNEYGRGIAWYLSTGLDDHDLGSVLALVRESAGVVPSFAPVPGLETVIRRAGETRWLFAINHASSPSAVRCEGTPFAGGTDLVTGAVVDDGMVVPAGGIAVIRSGFVASARSETAGQRPSHG